MNSQAVMMLLSRTHKMIQQVDKKILKVAGV
jgi:hypothetical protein